MRESRLTFANDAASYGSLARYTDIQRIVPINQNTMIGASGEYSDFQYIQKFAGYINFLFLSRKRHKISGELVTEDANQDDGSVLSAQEIHSLLTRVMYERANIPSYAMLSKQLEFSNLSGTTIAVG